MALEDLAMMRAITGATVLYPSDAVCAERIVETAARTTGIVYIRTSRPKTKVLYPERRGAFPVGGSEDAALERADKATVVAAGVTVYEALLAPRRAREGGVAVRVIDLYSVKPIDEATLLKAAAETKGIVSVEDHSACGGIGEAVAAAVSGRARVLVLGVREIPRSGKPAELMQAHGLSKEAIVSAVKRLLS
jgi:transketolase